MSDAIDSAKWTGRYQSNTTLTICKGGIVEKGDVIEIHGEGMFTVSNVQSNMLTVGRCKWYLRLWWWVKQQMSDLVWQIEAAVQQIARGLS